MRWLAVPVLALTLVACGGGDDDGGDAIGSVTTTAPETTAPESTTSTTVAVVAADSSADTAAPAPTTAAPTTAAPTTAAPTTAAPAPTTAPPTPTTAAPSADCLVGNWVISDSEMNAFYDTLEGQIDPGLTISITGQTLLDFTADTFQYTPSFTLTLDVVGQAGEGVTSGSVSGTYVSDDGLLTTTLTESNLDIAVTVMGQTFNGSDLGNGMLNSFPIVDSPYTCGPTPTIMFKTSIEGVRHPVTLTPA